MLTVVVNTPPVPQGSMVRTKYGVRHSRAEQLALFRAEVALAVRRAAERDEITLPLTGPLFLSATFTLARPKSTPKRRIHPLTRPDVDKLLRALCDALTQAGAWADDAQVVAVEAAKVYVGHRLAPLDGPGVALTIREVDA
jgi:Holliday junction resolvase RusA-like endonuclease